MILKSYGIDENSKIQLLYALPADTEYTESGSIKRKGPQMRMDAEENNKEILKRSREERMLEENRKKQKSWHQGMISDV